MSQHLFADAENGSEETFFRSAAWNATQLSLSDRSIFPIPHSAPAPTPPSMPSNCQALVPNLEVRMHPPAPPAILQMFNGLAKSYPENHKIILSHVKKLVETLPMIPDLP
jgi:hypothetical protein